MQWSFRRKCVTVVKSHPGVEEAEVMSAELHPFTASTNKLAYAQAFSRVSTPSRNTTAGARRRRSFALLHLPRRSR